MLLFAFHRWGRGFSGGGAVVMNPHAMWETWVQSLGQEDSPGGGQGNPLLYPCLENPMDWGAWWATVHGVKKSWTQLSALVCTHTYTQPHTHIHTHTHKWENWNLEVTCPRSLSGRDKGGLSPASLVPWSMFWIDFQMHWGPRVYFFSPKSIVVVVQSLRSVQFFVMPWTAARQASLVLHHLPEFLKLMSIELVMPSNHLVLCCPLLLTSVFPSIRTFSDECP